MATNRLYIENPPSTISMRVISWNCRGRGNESFRSEFENLYKTHHPDIFLLLSSKIPFVRVKNFFPIFGYDEFAVMDPVGRCIWILCGSPRMLPLSLWNLLIKPSILKSRRPISRSAFSPPFMLAPSQKESLWEKRRTIAEDLSIPWKLGTSMTYLTRMREWLSLKARKREDRQRPQLKLRRQLTNRGLLYGNYLNGLMLRSRTRACRMMGDRPSGTHDASGSLY